MSMNWLGVQESLESDHIEFQITITAVVIAWHPHLHCVKVIGLSPCYSNSSGLVTGLSIGFFNKMTPSMLDIFDSSQWFRPIKSVRLASAICVRPGNREASLSFSVSHYRCLCPHLLFLCLAPSQLLSINWKGPLGQLAPGKWISLHWV